MHRFHWRDLASLSILGAVGFVAYRADRMVAVDPPATELFQATLDHAYSRFRETDVDARPPSLAEREIEQLRVEGGAALATPAKKLHDHDGPAFREGARLMDEGKFEDAIAAYREALREDDKCPIAKHHIATAQTRAGRWEEAVNTYREALRVDPDYTCVYDHLEQIFDEHGQPENAAKMRDNALETLHRRARQSGPRGFQGRFELAHRYLALRRPADAKPIAAALLVERTEPGTLYLMALCQGSLGEKEAALAHLTRIESTDAKIQADVAKLRAVIESGSAVDVSAPTPSDHP